MRRTAVLIPLAALVLSGCGGGADEPTVLSVTTPAASATAGAPSASTTTTRAPATSAPGPTVAPPPAGPAAAYQVLAIEWQRARGIFFTAISENRLRPVAQQRNLAATYLRAQRAFAAGLTGTDWPAAARPAVRALIAVNQRQQAAIGAMAAAPSSGAFTTALGRYGTLTGPENAAVTAVAKALG
jgi:hypothetical protein